MIKKKFCFKEVALHKNKKWRFAIQKRLKTTAIDYRAKKSAGA
jgi:hypothetical protein